MKITEERIKKYTACLNELRIFAVRNGGHLTKQIQDEICHKHSTSRDILTRCIQLNYAKRTERGYYTFILNNFEPFHTRKVIEQCNQSNIDRKNKREELNKNLEQKCTPLTAEKETLKRTYTKRKIQITEPVKESKRVSILWGLFSWSRN